MQSCHEHGQRVCLDAALNAAWRVNLPFADAAALVGGLGAHVIKRLVANTMPARMSHLSICLTLTLIPATVANAQDTTPSTPPSCCASTPMPGPTGLFDEPRLVKAAADGADRRIGSGRMPDDGLYADFGNMITGAGWISAGPGYRHHVLHDHVVIDVSAALSWKLYKVAQARLEVPLLAHDRLLVGAGAMYQDLLQINYFGLGQDSLQDDRTAYRLDNLDVLGYARFRPVTRLTVDARLGWMSRPDLSPAAGPFLNVPNTLDEFSEESAPGLRTPSALVHGDVSISADWRDNPGHPTRGGLYRASATAYADPGEGLHSFRRYEVEASQFVPLVSTNWILALHAWGVFSYFSAGQVVPFYLMPSLGGHNTLRGYHDYRFHDNNAQSFNFESRWALLAHIDVAAFVDAGNVAPRAGDLDVTHLRTSYGAGVRVHTGSATVARVDVGRSREGWQIYFRMNDPFKRSAPVYGRSAVVPFVP
jgi:hypothetical protein